MTASTDIDHSTSLAEEWLRVVQDVAGVGIWDLHLGQPAAKCSESNRRLYGLPPATTMPPRDEWLNLIHPDDRTRVCRELDLAAAGGADFHSEFRVIWPDGAVHWLVGQCIGVCGATGKITRLIGVNYDITALKEAERELSHQARHDLLTGLPNRRFFDVQLKQAIADAAQTNRTIAVLYIDLDGFKVVNDTLGHAIGDALLQAVSYRLSTCVGHRGTLGRSGGDEFVMILNPCAGRPSAEAAARQILDALQKEFRISGHALYLTASMGISMFPDDGRDAGALQQNADIAMYHSKRSTKNAFQFFSSGMIEPLRERLLLETALRSALEKRQFSIHYQPLFGFDGENPELVQTGSEALLRWYHPEFGHVSPASFIPIAEETGMIVPIGTWVLERVCQQIRYWHEVGSRQGRVYVNVSGVQFARPDFAAIVARVLESAGIPGTSLGIEITESVLMSDFEACAGVVRDLRAIGVSISIDDFGTGYSCLGSLQRIPIDVLKIDGSFVKEIGIKPTAIALIGGIAALAHSLHMRVIAERIETERQLAAVRGAGCDEVQGYLLARPAAPTAPRSWNLTASTPMLAEGAA